MAADHEIPDRGGAARYGNVASRIYQDHAVSLRERLVAITGTGRRRRPGRGGIPAACRAGPRRPILGRPRGLAVPRRRQLAISRGRRWPVATRAMPGLVDRSVERVARGRGPACERCRRRDEALATLDRDDRDTGDDGCHRLLGRWRSPGSRPIPRGHPDAPVPSAWALHATCSRRARWPDAPGLTPTQIPLDGACRIGAPISAVRERGTRRDAHRADRGAAARHGWQ